MNTKKAPHAVRYFDDSRFDCTDGWSVSFSG